MNFEVNKSDEERVIRLLEALGIDYSLVEENESDFLGSLERENCHAAAERLCFAFDWEMSNEGNRFWEDIHMRLKEYAQYGGKL